MVTLMMMICCLLPRLSLCVVLQNVCHDVMLIWCCWWCYDDDVDNDIGDNQNDGDDDVDDDVVDNQNDGDDDIDENASASVFLSRSTKCVTWYDVNLMLMMMLMVMTIIKMMMMNIDDDDNASVSVSLSRASKCVSSSSKRNCYTTSLFRNSDKI